MALLLHLLIFLNDLVGDVMVALRFVQCKWQLEILRVNESKSGRMNGTHSTRGHKSFASLWYSLSPFFFFLFFVFFFFFFFVIIIEANAVRRESLCLRRQNTNYLMSLFSFLLSLFAPLQNWLFFCICTIHWCEGWSFEGWSYIILDEELPNLNKI